MALVAWTGCGFASPQVSACGPTNSPNWIKCMLELAPVRSPDLEERDTVYEAPGIIRVMKGRSCARENVGARTGYVGVRIREQQSVPLGIADSGTVFLNGWHVMYENGDHHVQGLGSAIANIQTTRNADQFTLNWEAGGVLMDENGDDPFQWCYWYTIVFWNRGAAGFDAVVSNVDGTMLQETASDPGNDSAVRDLPGGAWNSYGPGVVLPQGFAMVFADTDHHLRQIGLDYGQHYAGEANRIEWNGRTMLRDNDRRRDYYAGALFSTLSYSSPQHIHPKTVQRETSNGWVTVDNDVSLTPDTSSCEPHGYPLQREQYRVTGVPFEYAAPVLKGWELNYMCTDHHVRDMGVAITDWRYERNGDKGGTLYYTLDAALVDDSRNLSTAAASVDIFGMNARGIGVHPLHTTDTK